MIYGAITAIPLFFLWVFLSWVILLFGAVICYALHRFEITYKKSQDPFISSLQIVQFFAKAQEAEFKVNMELLKKEFPSMHEQTILNLVDKLIDLNFIAKLEDEKYCLTVNGKELTIADLYRRGDWRLPNSQETVNSDDLLIQTVEAANLHLDRELSTTLIQPKTKNERQKH